MHSGAFEKSVIFKPEDWEADRKARFDIDVVVNFFHRSVPALGFLKWTIEEVGRGYAITRLPLNVESSNQYITQQAALMLLSADYTGGIALSTLFKNAPIIGFNPQLTDYGAYLWGAAATIKWLRPSTDDLICKSSIPERDWDTIALAFDRGEEINYKARIKMFSGDRIAAVSDFQYWARNSHSLRSTGATKASTHHMLLHKLRTSARLIAGLRSWIKSGDAGAIEVLDPFAAHAAGPQGIAMARKFSLDTPQLADLVRARTLECDRALLAFSQRHDRFAVINLGCGYDSRPWRMPQLGNATFVLLDLPVMIHDRQGVMPPKSDSPYPIIDCEYDILSESLEDALEKVELPADLPKFFIWEGCSMYFAAADFNAFLKQIHDLMSPGSLLWFDYASTQAVLDKTSLPEVKAFMDSMRMIGEPFVHGIDDIETVMGKLDFKVIRSVSAASVVGAADPVFEHYSFALCDAH